MNPRFVWPAVVLVATAMIVTATMAILHVDRETIILVISMLVGPVLTAMVAAQVGHVQSVAENVREQTNGNQTRLMQIIEAQGRLLAASTPADTDATRPTE